jgi:hypothetical protein
MAEQQHVDAGLARKMPVRVLHRLAVGRGVEPAVRDRDQEVDVVRAQFRQPGARRLDQALRPHAAFKVALVPLHDLWRREADDADADRHLARPSLRVLQFDLAFEHRIRRIERLAVPRAVDVGEHQRERRPLAASRVDALGIHRLAAGLCEERQAVVELVVADGAAVVAERVHRAVHRQFLVAADRFHARLVVGQRGALDRVAGIEQQAVRKLGPCLAYQGRRALEADRGVRGELVVVVAEDIGVEIGGLEDREARTRAIDGRPGAARHTGRGTRAEQQGGEEKAATRGSGRHGEVRRRGGGADCARYRCCCAFPPGCGLVSRPRALR